MTAVSPIVLDKLLYVLHFLLSCPPAPQVDELIQSPTAATPSELDGSRVMNDGRSPPVDKSLTRIFVTGDSDQYYTVDITGFRNAAFIKELIFSKV